MNNSNVNKRMMPRQAIIIYSDGGQYQPEFYLESREIKQISGKYSLMTPTSLSEDVLKEVALSYMKDKSMDMDLGNSLIAGHLLYATNRIGKTIVMWYRPAMDRKLNFSASLGIKGDKSVEVPATLYLVINQKLYLYALMTAEKPGTGTKLYNAPFFNIYGDGNVCLGTARVGTKARTFEGEAERFERAFYMAEQNGGNGTGCKTDLTKLWAALIKKKQPFPVKKELIQHSKFKTLGELVTKLIGGSADED